MLETSRSPEERNIGTTYIYTPDKPGSTANFLYHSSNNNNTTLHPLH